MCGRFRQRATWSDVHVFFDAGEEPAAPVQHRARRRSTPSADSGPVRTLIRGDRSETLGRASGLQRLPPEIASAASAVLPAEVRCLRDKGLFMIVVHGQSWNAVTGRNFGGRRTLGPFVA